MAKYGYIGNNPDNTPVIIARQSYTATADQTTFTFSAGYTPGYIDVYLNGVKLIDVSDYTASSGNTVVLISAAGADDVIEIVAYKVFNIGDSNIGIQSAGTAVKTKGVQTLNFIGAGNTFATNGSVVDISIAGGGGGGLGTAIKYSDDATSSPFSYIDAHATVTENMNMTTDNAGEIDSYIVTVIPEIKIATGAAVTVGSGKTMVIDVLQIGGL